MENTTSPALLMCAIAFLIPIAQLALFKALLKTLTKPQNSKLRIARHGK